MRSQNFKKVAEGLHGLTDGAFRRHALEQLERAKWLFWNGQVRRGLTGLLHFGQRARARSFEHIPALKKLGNALPDIICYLELNFDSLPDYGKRYRSGSRYQLDLLNPRSFRSS